LISSFTHWLRSGRPGDTSSDDDHGATRFEWLAEHLRCPACLSVDIALLEGSADCSNCTRAFPIIDGAIDFLDTDTVAKYELVDTKNVSDHPFDGNALTIIDRCNQNGGMVLDCGSGYKSIAFDNVIQMDIVRYPNVDVLAVNQRLPFCDSSFDSVFSLDVLEHVNDPFTSASEIARVLKPGGYLYFDMPFLQAEHGYPNHYFNATRMGVCRLFDSLECTGQTVPASGVPMFTLHELLRVYREGLPEGSRGQFERMTVSEILSRSPLDWLEDPITNDLGADSRWRIASTTQAIFRKPPLAGQKSGTQNATMTLTPADLPGFSSLGNTSG
jgi:hypothetical protein